MSKYVGQSEENVRNLFADAEREQEQYGESSRLHVIVLDEMDAMCKRRGSSGDSTGALDGVVNQFLAKIDGVKALSNVFLIGMTNRKDMIDPALLRPGRLELLVEIGLPDEAGRAHILDIHTAKMRENGYLGSDVSTKTIAARARNFSGAELSGLVRAAQSYAVSREIDVRDPTRSRDGAVEGIRVCVADFDRALTEMKPAFGFDGERLDACIEHGIVPYSEEFDVMLRKCSGFVEQVQSATNGTSMLTLLLAGETGCGKSALAAYLARESGYPFVRRLSGAEFVGDSETAKTAKIVQAFEDAGKTPLSFLILDDLERLLDYVDIGPRFSNIVLQTLFNLLRKRANADHRMIVVGTTSDAVFMKQTGLRKAFSAALTVPLPRSSAHFAAVLRERTDFCPTEFPELCTRLVGRRVGVRTLLEVADMAAQQETSIRVDTYLDFLQDVMGEEGSVIDAM
jgi:vesicle-fusing ATPase